MSERRSDVILSRLMQLHPKVIDLSLDRTLEMLEALGNPQDNLPPVIHVAGTNGKGSTLAMLRSVFEAAGLKVHVYSSPHLVKFAERIRLAGEIIAEEELIKLLEFCEEANGNKPITFFEITTCAAFKAFSEVDADILLLETGLGGRLDSTNVVKKPAATILSSISMDHTQFLGDTLQAIATEKAHIQKKDVPSILGPQADIAMAVLEQVAEDQGATTFKHGRDWTMEEDGEDAMRFKCDGVDLLLPRPSLPGDHQVPNAGQVLATIQVMKKQGFNISDEAIIEGLKNAEWPARLQRIKSGPILDSLNDGWEFWLDGGHNAAAGDALAKMASQWQAKDDRPLYVIFGMLNTKAAGDFLKPLAPFVKDARSIAIPHEENTLSADESTAFGKEVGLNVSPAASIEEAVADIAKLEGPARLLICGSLYLAGTILYENH